MCLVPKVKPMCRLVGADGNIFNLIGIARRALNSAKMREEAKELVERAFSANSYDEALAIILEYVDPDIN